MTRRKKKFGIDSEFYAYGRNANGQSQIRYSYLRNSENNPLESLKSMMIEKGWDEIKIYRNPYEKDKKPFLMWRKLDGWFTPDYTIGSDIQIKLWVMPFHGSAITQYIPFTSLDKVTRKAVEILELKYCDYRKYKFARLYFNKKNINEQIYHYHISHKGIRQVMKREAFNKVQKIINHA